LNGIRRVTSTVWYHGNHDIYDIDDIYDMYCICDVASNIPFRGFWVLSLGFGYIMEILPHLTNGFRRFTSGFQALGGGTGERAPGAARGGARLVRSRASAVCRGGGGGGGGLTAAAAAPW
jgi:hypothetical protein